MGTVGINTDFKNVLRLRKLWKRCTQLILQLCTRHFGTILCIFFIYGNCHVVILIYQTFFSDDRFFFFFRISTKTDSLCARKNPIRLISLKYTLSIWINNQILKFSPGKGKHTEMKILKWHALKARLKFLLRYGWFSNYELDIPLSYVPISHEGPIQSAAHPLSHRPVTWLQAAFFLQLFAHDSVQFFPNHPSLHSTYIRTQYF